MSWESSSSTRLQVESAMRSGVVRLDNSSADGLRLSAGVAVAGYAASFATVTHELSHLLGTLDIYGSDAYNQNASLLGPTIFPNNFDLNTFYLDPWHMMQLGWKEPRIVRLQDASNFAFLDRAAIDDARGPILFFDPMRGTNEFYLAEYRNPGDTHNYDEDVAGTGVLLWYVMTQTTYDSTSRNVTVRTVDPRPGDGVEEIDRLDLATIDPLAAVTNNDANVTFWNAVDGNVRPRWFDGTDTGLSLQVGLPGSSSVPVSWKSSSVQKLTIDRVGISSYYVRPGAEISTRRHIRFTWNSDAQ